ncbi:MAG: autotransporter-associated beta strand repeat-containing protein, partial [Planctomycetota bacterium]
NGGTVASNGVAGNNNYNFAIGTGGRILALGGTTSAISASLGLNGQREFQVGAGSTLIVSGQVANWEGQAWGTINKTGAGVLQLTNSGNGYGGLMLSAGTVAVSAGSWANTGGNGYLADFQGFATLTWAAGNTTDISASNKFRIGDGITATLDTGTNTVTLGTAIVLGASKTGALTKVGAGTLTLSASNGYTGATTINGGVLALNNTNALAGGGNISFGGGTLQFSSNNTNDYSAKIKSSGSAISIDTNGNNVTFASILDSTNTGGFTKLGSGTLSMTSGASTFTGPVTISQGAVSVTTNVNGGALSSASSLSVATGATLLMTTTSSGKNALPVNAPWTINGSLTISAASTGQDFGNNMTLNSGTVSGSGGSNYGWLYWYGGTLAATGTSAISSASAIGFGSATVNTPNAGDILTISAPIGASSANSGSLTKTGAGTLTLSGSNTYTGATTISAGILSFGGTNSLRGTSGVTIAGGAGLTYTGGAATFGKNVTVTAGSGTGTITNSGGGLLTLSGNLSKDNSVLRLTGGSFNVTGLI